MNGLFQSCSSNLGFSFLFKHFPSINVYGLYCSWSSGVYSIFGWWDIRTLYLYQSIIFLILSSMNWFNILQLLILAVECTSYSSLTSGDRKTTYVSKSSLCDNNLNGWYRFQGAAGTRMPTTCPPMERCGTAGSGWLNGVHPTVADGRVTRQACFNWSSNCCWRSTNIEVRNCGSFYVYHFTGSGGCYHRYCGTA